jgi:HipA-like protein
MLAKIIGKIQYLFQSEDQDTPFDTPIEVSAEFELSYKNLIIGALKLTNGVWSFEYTDMFKAQEQIDAIIDFPNKNKIYQSTMLFPFFAARIPSLQRLKIQKMIPEGTTHDPVTLLKMFGKQSIANPYRLIPA